MVANADGESINLVGGMFNINLAYILYVATHIHGKGTELHYWTKSVVVYERHLKIILQTKNTYIHTYIITYIGWWSQPSIGGNCQW